MAVKKPLVITNGQVEQLQTGDSISGVDANIDGGRADTVYTVQDIDGGNASSF